MRITKIVNAGEIVDVHQVGRELAIIKAGNGLRVEGFDHQGVKVLDTEIYQGDNLSGLNCVLLRFVSSIEQEFIIWYSNFKYKFEKQSDRVRNVLGYSVPLRHGVNKLVAEDPARVNTKITSPIDIYIGGDNMVSGNGIVTNGRKFAANETFDLSNYGDVFYWVTDDASRIFKEYATRAKYAQNNGRTALEANGVPYFDIDVPPELDGVPFNIKARVRHKSQGVDGLDNYTNISVKPALLITQGDETTETLLRYDSYGSTGAYPGYEFNDKTLDVMVTLSAGVHRVFPVESELDYDATQEVGHDWYGDSFTTFISIYSDDPLLTVKGYAQVLEERA